MLCVRVTYLTADVVDAKRLSKNRNIFSPLSFRSLASISPDALIFFRRRVSESSEDTISLLDKEA